MPSWNKAYHGNCWGALGGEPVGVTSVKNLFYRTFGDIQRAIVEISEAGYRAIELFDGNLVEYEGKLGELRKRLDDAGLSLLAVYSGGNFIFPEILPEELGNETRDEEIWTPPHASANVHGNDCRSSPSFTPS